MKTTTTKTISTSAKLIATLIVLFLSSVSMSAQNTSGSVTSIIETEVNTTATSSQNVSANETMSFVSWFMGTKQTTNANQATEASSKKQMITSGIAPNRLLIKAFLKKASSYTSTIA